MSWAWDDDAGPDSRLDVTFRAVAAGTEVTLVHSRLDDATSRGHEKGWNGAFDKLAARASELT